MGTTFWTTSDASLNPLKRCPARPQLLAHLTHPSPLLSMLRPYPVQEMEAFRVSTIE